MSEIRYHTSDDLSDRQWDFNHRAWRQEDQSREEETINWEEYHHYVVAENENTPVGVLVVDFKAGVGNITEVIVENDSRGQGIGRQLMLECEELAKSNNVHKLWLETKRDYEAAFSLYTDLGYEIIAELPNYYNEENYLLMTKDL